MCRYHEAGRSRERPSRGRGMELVPSRRSPPKSSMFSGLAATMKGKAASMQEDAKGKVGRRRLLMHPRFQQESIYNSSSAAPSSRRCFRRATTAVLRDVPHYRLSACWRIDEGVEKLQLVHSKGLPFCGTAARL